MTVRAAESTDIDFIVELGREFHSQCAWDGIIDFNPADFSAFLEKLIVGAGVIFIDDKSICGAMMAPLYFNAGARIAVELFWFSRGSGHAVRQAFEAWAREQEADQIQMCCLIDEKEKPMRRLFKQMGYAPKELSLFKEV